MARTEGLLVEQIGAETVVYDTGDQQAHCLSPIAAAVFASADGHTGVEDLARLARSSVGETVDVEHVEEALAQLEERGLLAPSPGGISRRTMVRRTAVATAALTAAPLITSIITPAHAQIESPSAACPRARCSSQSEGDKFCNELGCTPVGGGTRDSCECELCEKLVEEGRISGPCPTPIPCPPGSSPQNPGPGGCQDPNKSIDGFCVVRKGDTTEPCAEDSAAQQRQSQNEIQSEGDGGKGDGGGTGGDGGGTGGDGGGTGGDGGGTGGDGGGTGGDGGGTGGDGGGTGGDGGGTGGDGGGTGGDGGSTGGDK